MIAPRLLLASLAMVFGLWPVALAIVLLVIAEHYMGMNLFRIALGLRFQSREQLDQAEPGSPAYKADRAFEKWGDGVFGHPDKGRKGAPSVIGWKEVNGVKIAQIKCPECKKKIWINGEGEPSSCRLCGADFQ